MIVCDCCGILINKGGITVPRKKTPEMYQYEQNYIKETYKWVNIQFSQKNPEDMEIYDHIANQPESKAAYIKRLVREDMQRTK